MKTRQKIIACAELVCLDAHTASAPMRIALDYARPDNLLFGEAIYRSDAQLLLYKDLAAIVIEAARRVNTQGLCLVVHDGLRTVEAQAKMLQTQRVRDNPQWLQEPRLLSPPGAGGHPRAMAVDVSLESMTGDSLDMGTPFDFLAPDSAVEHNPAHREHPHLSNTSKANRAVLNDAMLGAARDLLQRRAITMPLLGLPQEWWDFRAPAEFYEGFAPISDADLPEEMRVCDISTGR